MRTNEHIGEVQARAARANASMRKGRQQLIATSTGPKRRSGHPTRLTPTLHSVSGVAVRTLRKSATGGLPPTFRVGSLMPAGLVQPTDAGPPPRSEAGMPAPVEAHV